MTAVLSASAVAKAYDMHWSHGAPSLRTVFNRQKALLRDPDSIRWALDDVSFQIAAGRSLGLIGHNGAGKSTLLRLASGLGRPTRGRLRTDSDTASVLNLGSTFDLQLTGLENALTTAVVAGLTQRQARAAMDDIVEFSGLGEFMDAPVRTYSEGMKLRLAFSVVTWRRPRLLVLDEVLAVGDADFHRACEDRIAEMQAAGTSVLLASHSLEEVETTCQDALWLHRGRVRGYGDAATVGESYLEAVHEETLARTPVGAGDGRGGLVLGEDRFGSQELVIEEVLIDGRPSDRGPAVVSTGSPLKLELALLARGDPIDEPIVGVTLRRAGVELIVFDLNSSTDRLSLGKGLIHARVELALDRLDLPAGDYTLDVGVYEQSWEHAYDFHWGAYAIRVEGRSTGQGVLQPPHRWRAL